jgi:hypothetical protein
LIEFEYWAYPVNTGRDAQQTTDSLQPPAVQEACIIMVTHSSISDQRLPNEPDDETGTLDRRSSSLWAMMGAVLYITVSLSSLKDVRILYGVYVRVDLEDMVEHRQLRERRAQQTLDPLQPTGQPRRSKKTA